MPSKATPVQSPRRMDTRKGRLIRQRGRVLMRVFRFSFHLPRHSYCFQGRTRTRHASGFGAGTAYPVQCRKDDRGHQDLQNGPIDSQAASERTAWRHQANHARIPAVSHEHAILLVVRSSWSVVRGGSLAHLSLPRNNGPQRPRPLPGERTTDNGRRAPASPHFNTSIVFLARYDPASSW